MRGVSLYHNRQGRVYHNRSREVPSYENEIKSSEGFVGHVKSKKKLVFLPSLLSMYASVNIKTKHPTIPLTQLITSYLLYDKSVGLQLPV